MKKARVDFRISQGDSFKRTLAFKKAGGGSVDLSGYEVEMKIREEPDDDRVILALNSSGENDFIKVVEPEENGIVSIQISAGTTASFFFNSAYYDIEFTKGEDKIKPIQGFFRLEKEITR